MRSNLYLITILLFSGIRSGYAGLAADSNIVIGSKHKLYSEILKEEREYWIYLPPDYTNSKYIAGHYPVVYLLDGETSFHSFTGIQQYLSKGAYAVIPQMIVVGIVNTDRTRDLTPTKASRGAFYEKGAAMFTNSGGNDVFIKFLQNELIPTIDRNYRTDSYRILVGHSFGGLTAVNVLLNHTDLFNAYIAIDPSLWWDGELMLNQAKGQFPFKDYRKKILFAARANKTIVPQDTTTDMQRSNINFESALSGLSPKNLTWKYNFYEDDDHGTIPVPAGFDGLKYIFKGHQVHVKMAVDNPSVVLKNFQVLSERLGHTFVPSESWTDWMGNYCLGIGKTDSAIQFFQMNLERYPLSFNVYVSLAKAYEKAGNNEQAKIFTQKAASLKQKTSGR